MDFTLKIYKELLLALLKNGYHFNTVAEYCDRKTDGSFVLLRHDVDLRAGHSLATAQIEAQLGIKASYYFRVVPQSNQPEIIQAIAGLGHEIGYHYEDLSLFKGDETKALAHFEKQLAYFRQYYPVRTICMHGSPTSQYDNRDIWKKYNYRDYGIIGEPYFDIDFTQLHYITDTGRMWDGERYSVRDKVVNTGVLKVEDNEHSTAKSTSFHSTQEMIQALELAKFPNQVMITTHPQRWTDNYFEWMLELIAQRLKNIVKRLLLSIKR